MECAAGVGMYVDMTAQVSSLTDYRNCIKIFRVLFITARRAASVVYAVVVCLSVCVSVTLQYCIKTAKLRITPIMPHDSPETLVF